MKSRLELKLEEDIDNIRRIISADGILNTSRSNAQISEAADALIISIEAEDITALTASVNSVLKVLSVYEKTKMISNDK